LKQRNGFNHQSLTSPVFILTKRNWNWDWVDLND